MKKIFTLIVSLCTLSTVFAQQNNSRFLDQRSNRDVSYQPRSYDQPTYGRNVNTVDYGRNNDQRDINVYSDRQRQEEMNRNNHGSDDRRGGYRNQGVYDAYGRDRRMQEPVRERNSNIKSLGAGVVIGGILGVLIGSQL